MKTSLAIWALGPMVTRFVPGGYQPQRAAKTTVDRVGRAVEGLGAVVLFVLTRPRKLRILETALRPMSEASWG